MCWRRLARGMVSWSGYRAKTLRILELLFPTSQESQAQFGLWRVAHLASHVRCQNLGIGEGSPRKTWKTHK